MQRFVLPQLAEGFVFPEPLRASDLAGQRVLFPCQQATYPGRRFALPWAISFCPLGAGDRSTRKSSVITQQATEVLRLQQRPRCEQERRDKADAAVMQAARCRIHAELRKLSCESKYPVVS